MTASVDSGRSAGLQSSSITVTPRSFISTSISSNSSRESLSSPTYGLSNINRSGKSNIRFIISSFLSSPLER